jgi:uncharacterized protein with HEPN domain
MDFQTFLNDRRTLDTVTLKLIVIAEATVHLPEEVAANNPSIPWAEMRALRNFVVHEYFSVSEKIVWDTIKSDLATVIHPLEKLRKDKS